MAALVLASAQGQAQTGATIPFLLDVEVHARFLLAIPLLIAAELVVHQRMRHVLKQFLERQLIPTDAMTRFDAAIEAALRLRISVRAEVLLFSRPDSCRACRSADLQENARRTGIASGLWLEEVEQAVAVSGARTLCGVPG